MAELIERRKDQMKSPDYVPRNDFLSLLMEDELFKDSIDLMVDECSLFMLASTQSTAMHIFFSIYYLVRYPDYLKKVRAEVT
jgi:cytochrome P450